MSFVSNESVNVLDISERGKDLIYALKMVILPCFIIVVAWIMCKNAAIDRAIPFSSGHADGQVIIQSAQDGGSR